MSQDDQKDKLNELMKQHDAHYEMRIKRLKEKNKAKIQQFETRLKKKEERIKQKRELLKTKSIPSRKVAVLNFFLGAMVLLFSFTLAAWIAPKIFSVVGKPVWFFPQVITSFIGIFIMGTFLSTLGRFFKRFQDSRMMGHTKLIEDVKSAVDAIASGNLNVKINEERYYENEPFIELVKSVNKMVEEVGTMEKMRKDFVSNVSHEIQSPLTSIKGFAQVLRNDALSVEERNQYLDIIINESSRLSKLSDNLLKLSALESERNVLEYREFSLDGQIQQVILNCEPQWATKKIELDIDLERMSIQADRDLLSQVWLNLIHNAIKFTPESGLMTMSLKADQNLAVFNISDTGIGITEEEKLHLFERFYKGDKSRNREKGGNGLGLAIVKKIIDLHGGEILVESELGKGTIFTVKLPIK